MKKTVNEALNAFAANPIEFKKDFYSKVCRHWDASDVELFWEQSMANYPNNKLKRTANRLIKFLYNENLIDYEDIVYDFVECQKSFDFDYDTDLRTHTINFIAGYYDWWLDDARGYEAEDLREAVKNARKVWYWDELLSYCVEKNADKCGFVERAVNEIKRLVN